MVKTRVIVSWYGACRLSSVCGIQGESGQWTVWAVNYYKVEMGGAFLNRLLRYYLEVTYPGLSFPTRCFVRGKFTFQKVKSKRS